MLNVSRTAICGVSQMRSTALPVRNTIIVNFKAEKGGEGEHLVKHRALLRAQLLHRADAQGAGPAPHGSFLDICREVVSFWVGMHMLLPTWSHNGRTSPHSHQYTSVSSVTHSCSQWALVFANHAVWVVTSLWERNSLFSLFILRVWDSLPCSQTFTHLSSGLSVSGH